uniref:histidine kinase n=1 Tax=Desulfovibrio sp. U5L TaxID=596152 RepID=I2Q689_9BACT
MAKPSITLKYLLWTWVFFLLVLSLVFVFATRRVERSVMAEAEERARISLNLAGHLLAVHAPFADEAALAAWADDLGPHLGFRLTYIVAGRVVADSEVRAAGVGEMEDHASRPEVRLARETGFGQDVRQSHTLGRDMLYVAEAYAGSSGVPAGILRLALPVSSLRGEVARFRDTLLTVLALVFAAGGVAAWGLARRMTGTVREISEAVADIGHGHYDRRIHIVWASDFAPLAGAINVLGERIGSHVREIEVRRERQEAILDGMAEGLAILDASGRIIAANRALRELFPRLPELVGRTPLEVGMPLCVERALDAFEPGDGKSKRIGRFELQSGRVVEVTVAGVAGDAAGPGRVVTFHDVTEAATMERIFRDFVIDASHNLRTPLTKVLGFAESARDMLAADPAAELVGERARAGAAQALSTVARAAEDMAGVINDLLAAARDRFAKAREAAPPVDALAALKQALAAAGTLLRAKGVTARIVSAPDGPLPVREDYEALVRIFSSLLSQVPDAASLAVTAGVTGESGESVEIRFQGPAPMDLALPTAGLVGGGEVFLDGATRVVRLPRAAG